MTPDVLEGLPENIVKQFRLLEERVMSDVIRRLRNNGKEIIRSADWQLYRLQELGLTKLEIRRYIKEALDVTDEELDGIYEKVIEDGFSYDDSIYKGLDVTDEDSFRQLADGIRRQTDDEFSNITQTTGFAIDKNGKISYTSVTDVLDGAMLDISSGLFDYNTVLKRVVEQMTNSGLRTIDYASGWSNRVDVAARRAIMTGVAQLTGKINESNAEKLGTETFEVSWHSGARPSHLEWQGKWYTRDELVSICGLGTITGLLGANCYHSYSPVIPGISKPTYTEEQLERMKREELTPKEYGGKKYTKYEALQKQRRMETTMRAQRQKIKLLEEGGADEDDIINARCRYRGTSAEYARFSKAMDLPQQRERVYIDGLGDIGKGKWKTQKNSMSKHREYNGKTWSKTGKKISQEEYESLVRYAEDKGIKLVSFQNFDGDVDLIYEMLDNAETVLNDFPKLIEGKTKLQIHNSFNMQDDDFAMTLGNKVYINNFAFRDKTLLANEYDKLVKEGWFVDGSDYRSVIHHELGHVVANVYGLSSMNIAKEITGLSHKETLKYVESNLSEYSAKDLKGLEIISEVFSGIYSGTSNNFALKYYAECVKIILKRGGA